MRRWRWRVRKRPGSAWAALQKCPAGPRGPGPAPASCGLLQDDGMAAAEPEHVSFQAGRECILRDAEGRRAGVEQDAPTRPAQFHRALLLGEEDRERERLALVETAEKEAAAFGGHLERIAAVILQSGMFAAKRKERRVPAERRLSLAGGAPFPVDAALLECLLRLRVGDLAAEVVEGLELLAPPLAHRLDERFVAVGDEVEERFGRPPFLALEVQGQRRGKRGERRRDAGASRRGQLHQAVAPRAVADLVVVLREDDEAASGQVRRGCSVLAAAVLRMPAGVV